MEIRDERGTTSDQWEEQYISTHVNKPAWAHSYTPILTFTKEKGDTPS